MNKIGVLIRKVDVNEEGIKTPVTRSQYRKQLITLLKKLKKKDPSIWFQYSIEKDDCRRFHIHMIIHYNHSKNLYNELFRFIGGVGSTIKKNEIEGLETIQGRFGEIDLHTIWNEVGFIHYINKYQPSESLF
jgi:hypothetical protein